MSAKHFIRLNGIRVSPDTWEGRVHGRLKPIGHRFKIGSRAFVVCQCQCGIVGVKTACHVAGGLSVSCGCYQKEAARGAKTTHGMSVSVEYNTWRGMLERCGDENNKHFRHYGGRGISVCDRWLNSFANFIDDMGRKPSSSHSIDRIDNSKGYEPSNCRWATRTEQCNNQRPNVRVAIYGKSRTPAEWSKISMVDAHTIRKRLRNGWEPKRAVFFMDDVMTQRATARMMGIK